MSHLAFLLVAITWSSDSGDTPLLFREKSVSPLSLARAVNHYVSLGEEATVKELEALASKSSSAVERAMKTHERIGKDAERLVELGLLVDIGLLMERENMTQERIGWVCRILYPPKGKSPIRAPLFGALLLPHKTMPLADWPLYPIAFSGSTYFALSQGYMSGGLPEGAETYLEHCRSKGQFRMTPIPLPNRDQAMKDATRLRQSEPWKAIKWVDSGKGFSYSLDEGSVWDFIKGQAEAIPAK